MPPTLYEAAMAVLGLVLVVAFILASVPLSMPIVSVILLASGMAR